MRAKDPSGAGEAESLLARWSRRKRQGDRSPEERDRTSEPNSPLGSEKSAPVSREPAAPPPGDSDMPPLESLGPESDYSGFMSPEVSEELRRLALRKLFHSPLYNITDGLDDYDDDFTSFAVLHEAFHAKRGKTAASESAPPEGVDHESVGESGREQPARTSSAEVEPGAEAGSAAPADGEAEQGRRQAASEPDARASDPHLEVSGGTDLTEEGGSAPAGLEPDDADAPAGSVESAALRPSSAGLSGEPKAVETIRGSSAHPSVDDKAPAESPNDREDAEDRDTRGHQPDGGHRHG